MAEPPSSAGATHSRSTAASNGEADSSVGAPGAVSTNGVTGSLGSDQPPCSASSPSPITTRTSKTYDVPFTSPSTVVVVAVLGASSSTVVQVVPSYQRTT